MYRLPFALGVLAALSATVLPAQHLALDVSAHLQRSQNLARAAVVNLIPGGGDASDNPHVTYDWTTRTVQRTRRLRSGGSVGVRMEGMNPLCYVYTLGVQEVAGSDETFDVAKLLAGGYAPSQPADASGVAAGSGNSGRAPLGQEDTVEAARPRAELVRELSDNLTRTVSLIADELPAWRESVGGFDNRICASPAAAGLSHAIVLQRWRAEAEPELNQMGNALDALQRLRSRAQALADEDLYNRADASIRELAEIVADGNRSRDRLDAPETSTHVRVLEDDTKQAVFTFQARPYAEYPGLLPISENHTVTVRRYHRQFLSLGFVRTDADAADYERRRVISGDTTVSTYVDVGRGSSWVVSPVVSVNYTLFDVPVFEAFHPTLMLSGGVTTDGTDPQFLLGTGIGLSDRVVLSAYAHFYPSEKLLLGDPTVIRGRAVPDDISDEDAVRTRFNTGFAFGLSYRL